MSETDRKYRERRAKMVQKLFEGFEPNTEKAKEPEIVLTVLLMCKAGYLSHEIAKKIGKSPKAVQKIFRRYNFPRMHNFALREREEKSTWKGGVKYMKGYKYVICPNHPNGTKHGNYVAEHRLVMEKKLGRYLKPTEVVDHIDGDITNNHPSNLRVFASNGEHLSETLKGRVPNWSEEGIKKQKRFCKGFYRRKSGYSKGDSRD